MTKRIEQKILGVLMLVLSLVIWRLCSLGTTPADQDGTILLLTVPMGIWMLFSKKIIIY